MTAADEIVIQDRPAEDAALLTLRGRAAELAVADRLLADLRAGRGGVLLLEGRPGMGKTRLLDELCDRADRAGARVLRAEVLDGQQEVLPAPLLGALLGAQPPIVDPGAVRGLGSFWLVHELRDALERAAARTPVVIALDGLQWADGATVTAVRALTADLRDTPVLWMLAARRGQSGGAVRDLFSHLAGDGAGTLRLRPLEAADATTLVEDLAHASASPALVELADTAQGHPYWLRELLLGLREEGRLTIAGRQATPSGDQPPRRIIRLVLERLEALTIQTRQMLRIGAVLPDRFTAEQLARLMSRNPADLIEPLDEAIRADLIAVSGAELSFRPRLLRPAVRGTMPGSLRRVLEREAVELLLRTGADPVEVAGVLAETAEAGDRSAVATLRAAARTLAGSDATAAADLCVRAFDLLPADDTERGPTATEAVDLLHRADRGADAGRLAGRALAGLLTTGHEAELRLRMSAMVARPLSARMRDNRIALTLPGLPGHMRVRHHARLAHNLMMAGDQDTAQRLALRTLAEAEQASDPEAVAVARTALAATHTAQGAAGPAWAAVQALTAPDTRHDVVAAVLLHCLGHGDEGAAALTDCLRRARRERNAPLLGLVAQLAGQVDLVTGRLAQVPVDIRPAPADHGLGAVLRMVTTAGVAAHLGDNDLVRAAATAAKRLRAADTVVERRWAGRVLALAAAQRDDPAYACRLLAEDPLLPASPPLPYDITFLVAAARAAVAAGDRGLSGRLIPVAAALAANRRDAPAFAAGAGHLLGLLHGSVPALLAAAEEHTAVHRPLLAAAAAEDAGQLLLDGARVTAGLEHLGRAFDAYDAAGATGDARRVGRLLSRHGTRRRAGARRHNAGWASLTDAELRVVRVIAAGATNRHAAEQLYLSPHTVNAHVRRAFAKLGIRSRVQLANVVRDNNG